METEKIQELEQTVAYLKRQFHAIHRFLHEEFDHYQGCYLIDMKKTSE